MQIIDNDIFSCTEDIIVHQVNCQGVMGHGIAKQVKDMYYEVYEAYKLHCDMNDKKDLLGTVLYVDIGNKIIANIFGQLYYGKGLQTDYEALRMGLTDVYHYAKKNNLSVAIPYKIGCGLAGGNWDVVYRIIESIFTDVPTVLYKKERKESY